MERFIKRPAPGQDEEDLLDFQARFLSSGQKPSATLVKCAKTENNPTQKDVVQMEIDQIQDASAPKIKQSKFRKEREKTEQSSHDGDMIDEMNKMDMHITTVLSNIIKERDVSNKVINFPSSRTTAFPHPSKSKDFKKCDKKGRQSLFAQQFKQPPIKQVDKSKKVMTCKLKTLEEGISKMRLKDLYPESRIVTGFGLSNSPNTSHVKEVDQINDDNIAKLSQMSEQDIIMEQNKLKSSLDPKMLNFLTKRRTDKNKSTEERFLSDLRTDIQKEKTIKLDLIKQQEENQTPPKEVEDLKNRWMNMDVVEEDKLKWMQEPSSVKEKQDSKYTSKKIDITQRFDFDGNFLSIKNCIEIPSHIGLHHHGNQPDLAGYTLQELVDLSRSEFMQQRVLSLKILAKIILKDKEGYYGTTLSRCILSLLLEAGLPFIIRWSLDEKSQVCLQASIQLLWAVLCLRREEREFLDVNFLSFRGCEFPSLQIMSYMSGKASRIETDFELTSQDLVLGFIKMDILPRLRYILEVCKPDLNIKVKCYEILERICSHSLHACMKVVDCPRLIKYVVEHHMPVMWTLSEQDSSKLPLPQALRLIRIICQSGKHVTNRLLTDHENLMTTILRFTHIVGGIAFQEKHDLEKDGRNGNVNSLLYESEVEAWKLWTVCLSYGITINVFKDSSSNLVQQLQKCNLIIHQPFNTAQYNWVCHVLRCFAGVSNNITVLNDETNKHLSYNDIEGYIGMIGVLLEDLVGMILSHSSSPKRSACFGLLSCGLDILFICLQKLIDLSANELDSALVKDTTLSLLTSVKPAISDLAGNSPISSNTIPDIPSLPSLKLQFSEAEDKKQFICSISNQQFINSYLRCACALHRSDKRIVTNFAEDIHADLNLATSLFTTRVFVHTLYWLSKYFVLTTNEGSSLNQKELKYFHNISMSAISNLLPSDEHYAHDLLSTVLFHPILNSYPDSNDQDGLDLNLELSRIRATYMQCFAISQKLLLQSKHLSCQNFQEISTFFIPPSFSGNLFPVDWLFLPIMQVYDMIVNQGEFETPDAISVAVQTVKSCLSFLNFLIKLRCESLQQMKPTAIIARLMCVFMTGSDVFLEQSIHSLLTNIFVSICSNLKNGDLDFDLGIPGITSFSDFYASLVEHFECESYGNDLFAFVILLPLTQAGPSKLKLCLWSQRSECLNLIHLQLNQILLPVYFYLEPQEENFDVISSYIRALARGNCSIKNSPFLYKLAIHHISLFLFNENLTVSEVARRNAFNLVNLINDEVIRQHIFNYDGSKTNESFSNNICPGRNLRLLKWYNQNV